MISDIRVAIGFVNHPKRRKLARLLDKEGCADYLIDLWINVALRKPSGELDGWDMEDIAIAAGWRGDAEQFVKALIKSGFLDSPVPYVYKMHDWEDHEGWVVDAKKRSENARKNIKKRWNRERKGDTSGNSSRITNSNTDANTMDGKGEVRKGKGREGKELGEEGVGEGEFLVIDGLQKWKDYDFGAACLINDRDYLALIKSVLPEDDSLEMKVAFAWVGYRRFYRHGTGLKASFSHLARLIQDGMSIYQIWKICEAAHKSDGIKTALPVWEVVTTPVAVKAEADHSREIIRAKQRERESEERRIRRDGNSAPMPQKFKELLKGIGTKVELTESEKALSWKGG